MLKRPKRNRARELGNAQLFALFAAVLIVLHAPLLRLPYFWDEAGYYIPAAYDLFSTGALIPHSTLTNAHPPLPSIYLSMAWKVATFKPVVTRIAMLLVAAWGLLAVYRLGRLLANPVVAAATTLCTALYPVWFAQNSLAHADLPAAACTLWGLVFYFEGHRPWRAGLLFAAACLSKETAAITPMALVVHELVRARRSEVRSVTERTLPLLASVLPLFAWYGYHYGKTGYFFGNPEFVKYNVAGTLTLTRFLLAFVRRVWHLTGYLNLWALTLATVYAMLGPALKEGSWERPRIAVSAQLTMAGVIFVHIITFSLLGGAALARYLLPVYPLVILIFVSTLWRRLLHWRVVLAIVLVAFVAGWFWAPLQHVPPEDNLGYRDFVLLHEDAIAYLSQQGGSNVVLTAWPATDELRKPIVGFVPKPPVRVYAIDDFSFEQLSAAAANPQEFSMAFVFSTKNEPERELAFRWGWMQRMAERYFGYHRDLLPEAAARILGGRVVWQEHRGRQWAAVILCDRDRLAGLR